MIRLFYIIGLLGVIALALFFGWWALDSLREHFGETRSSFAVVTVWLSFLTMRMIARRRNDQDR